MQPSRTPEIATGRWRGILASLGLDERFLNAKHGPCPMCGGKDRWRFDDKRGRGTWICSNCGAGDGFKLLQLYHGWGFRQAATEVERVVGIVEPEKIREESDEAKKIAAIRRVWEESEAVLVGDPVWQYLRARVQIDLIPACLRHHPALPYRHEDGSVSHHPAMLAAVTYPDGKVASIHRTYLQRGGRKADVESAKKLMSGKPLQTASIKLCPAGERLGLAEGIETALAASRKFQVPAWSCVSSSLMATWLPPESVKCVIVFGDNDAKYAGQAAAYGLAHKLAMRGIECEVRIPDAAGTDWADA